MHTKISMSLVNCTIVQFTQAKCLIVDSLVKYRPIRTRSWSKILFQCCMGEDSSFLEFRLVIDMSKWYYSTAQTFPHFWKVSEGEGLKNIGNIKERKSQPQTSFSSIPLEIEEHSQTLAIVKPAVTIIIVENRICFLQSFLDLADKVWTFSST